MCLELSLNITLFHDWPTHASPEVNCYPRFVLFFPLIYFVTLPHVYVFLSAILVIFSFTFMNVESSWIHILQTHFFTSAFCFWDESLLLTSVAVVLSFHSVLPYECTTMKIIFFCWKKLWISSTVFLLETVKAQAILFYISSCTHVSEFL